VRRALDLGEPSRVAYAYIGEAILHGFEGTRGQWKADEMLARARSLYQRLEQPYLRAMLEVAEGFAAHMGRGLFRKGLGHFDEATRMFTEVPGASFERSSARFMAVEALMWLGETAEIRRRVPEILRDARRRGDMWLQVATVGGEGYFNWLPADRPHELSALLDEVMANWSQSGFRVGHLYVELARTQIDLYNGDANAARERLNSRWSKMYRIARYWQEGRTTCVDLLGRTALALAQKSGARDAKALLKQVGRCIRRLDRERSPLSSVFSSLLRAGLAAVAGDRSSMVSLLEVAEETAMVHEMALYAACARRRRGHLLGGDQGRDLVRSADAFMSEQEIVRPEKIVELLSPGFSV
jgi:hypothetical protein